MKIEINKKKTSTTLGPENPCSAQEINPAPAHSAFSPSHSHWVFGPTC
jgi:hypothetical protein